MPITYAQERTLSAKEFADLLARTLMGQRRPLAQLERLDTMLANANFIVTARAEDGELIGVARCLTDFSWICYCAELAVAQDMQGQGVGKAIMAKCAELLGPGVGIVLISEPTATGFYQAIGMTPLEHGYMRHRTDDT